MGKTIDLEHVFSYYKKGLIQSKAKQEALTPLGLLMEKIDIGFNSGQIHHRKEDAYKMALAELGIIYPSGIIGRDGIETYFSFGKNCFMFPLRDEAGEIINLCALNPSSKEEQFLKPDNEGIFSTRETTNPLKKITLCGSVLDAALLLSQLTQKKEELIIGLPNGKLNTSIKDYLKKVATPLTEITTFRMNNE
jgi:DNA primase